MSDHQSAANTPTNGPDSRYRLPPNVAPTNYKIRLVPNLREEAFTGSVQIAIEVVSPVSQIVLNSSELEIVSATVNQEAVKVTLNPDLERLTLHQQLPKGPATIEVKYRGIFNAQMVGFYLSNFTDETGASQALATTQFESTYARKAFPCWDEPSIKATFDITIVVPPGMQAISNSAEIGRSSGPSGDEVTFATTMVMSTYLVAFVVGPLEMTKSVDVAGVPLRVVHVRGAGSTEVPSLAPVLTGDQPGGQPDSPPNTTKTGPLTVDLTAFALECGQFALDYFSEYFDQPYPGDKIDLVAIPDFAMGAMENLGCVTFRESLLLVDPDSSTQPELQRVADVIFHELAHMWFGDLVTMKWWNGLWLNEAFATFMEMRCTDAFRPEWQRWADFGLSRTAAFDIDALATTRPIEYEVHSPDDAEGMFDVLTYEKGAAVVRMLEQYLGEEAFRAGIRRYMTSHAYGNTETTDLWDAIETETGEPVRAIMDSWIFQGGTPLVSVELAPNGKSVTFSQEPLAYTEGREPSEESGPDERLWIAPLRYRWKPFNADPVTASVLLDSASVTISLESQAEWLIANAEGTSYLRTLYPPEALDTLGAVAFDFLSPIERYALVDDAWAAVLADSMTAASFLSLLESLTAENDRSVWQRILAGLRSLDRLLSGESRQNFQSIAHDAIAPSLAGLTLSPQSDDDDRSRQLRGDLIRAMGTIANDYEIQEEAKRTVAQALRNPQMVDASILAGAIDVTASLGDDVDLEDFIGAFRTAGTPQEQLRYLYATADFPEFDQLQRVLELIMSGDVRPQNAPQWLNRALRNRENGPRVWEFIQENWEELSQLVATASIVRFLSGLSSLTSPESADQTVAFFAKHPVPQGEQTLLQILERQRVEVALVGRETARFNAILAP